MSRSPDRSEPKKHLQVSIELETFNSFEQVFLNQSSMFSNLSEATETVLFLAMSAYHEDAQDHFARRLLKTKAITILSTDNLTKKAAFKRLHLYIDADAFRFLDMFIAKYPRLCANRKDALELLYNYAVLCCTKQQAHFFSRLREVRLLHP